MRAIITRYSEGRYIARAYGGRASVAKDYSLNSDANHERAALALCAKMGWSGKLIAGSSPDRGSGYVFVFVEWHEGTGKSSYAVPVIVK